VRLGVYCDVANLERWARAVGNAPELFVLRRPVEGRRCRRSPRRFAPPELLEPGGLSACRSCRRLSPGLGLGVEISESPLYQLVEGHLEELLRLWASRLVRSHGPLRPLVERVLREFLRCGLLEHGWVRASWSCARPTDSR
jgi:hypothetical protein